MTKFLLYCREGRSGRVFQLFICSSKTSYMVTRAPELGGFKSSQDKSQVKSHRGEPGQTGHKGTRSTQTNLTTIQTHQPTAGTVPVLDFPRCLFTGKKTPGGAGTHTGHTGHTGTLPVQCLSWRGFFFGHDGLFTGTVLVLEGLLFRTRRASRAFTTRNSRATTRATTIEPTASNDG